MSAYRFLLDLLRQSTSLVSNSKPFNTNYNHENFSVTFIDDLRDALLFIRK
jgi:hypothetical protein